jgi:hypothetical protein
LAWFNNYTPQQWIGMYAADGVGTDAIYGLLGAPAYTIEMGVTFFESCDTFESRTLPRNLDALRYAARNVQSPYTLPSGPDTVALSASNRRVAAGTPLVVTATVDDSRFNQSNGTETVQAISADAGQRRSIQLEPGTGAGYDPDRQPCTRTALGRGARRRCQRTCRHPESLLLHGPVSVEGNGHPSCGTPDTPAHQIGRAAFPFVAPVVAS